ncbi:MAG: hypothetical protein M1475_07750 [Actinobacteria bacterium]|nr:hypothetical protein [Actinomycetota bacterium]
MSFGLHVQNISTSVSGIMVIKSENPDHRIGTACICKSVSSLHIKYAINIMLMSKKLKRF